GARPARDGLHVPGGREGRRWAHGHPTRAAHRGADDRAANEVREGSAPWARVALSARQGRGRTGGAPGAHPRGGGSTRTAAFMLEARGLSEDERGVRHGFRRWRGKETTSVGRWV